MKKEIELAEKYLELLVKGCDIPMVEKEERYWDYENYIFMLKRNEVKYNQRLNESLKYKRKTDMDVYLKEVRGN